MKKFVAKRFDLLVSLDWAAAYNARNAGLSPDDYQAVWVLDESLSYWYGLNLATDPEVARRLNAALQKVKNDGQYLLLKQKYLPKTSK
jgi:polar amino acid transport system substrate-binding protein